MKTKTTKQIVWCVYLDVTLTPQWCAANSKEAKALINCPEYIVGHYSRRKDKQVQEDAEATRRELLQRKAA